MTAREASSTAKGMYYLFVGNVTTTILLAVAIIFVSRLLGPSGYGLYSIALVTPTYAMTFIQLGIPSAATRYSAKLKSEGEEGEGASFLYSMMLFQGALSLVAMAILLPLSGLIAGSLLSRPGASHLILLAELSVVGQALFTVGSAGFQGMNRMDLSAGMQVLQAAVKLVATVSLILLGFAVAGAVGAYTICFVVSGLACLWFVAKMHGSLLPKGFRLHSKEALRYSFPLYVAALVGGVVGPFQLTLLAHYRSNAAIGGYAAANNMATLVILFTFPITTALFPLFTAMARDEGKLAELYDRTVRFSTIFVVPVAAAMISLSTPLTSAVYGRAYSFAGGYLALLLVPYLFAGMGSLAQGALLNGMGETTKYLLASVAGSVIALAGSTILSPFVGVYGVILASVAGSAVSLIVAWGMVGKRLGRNITLSRIWRVYVASGVAALLVFPASLLPLHPILVTLIGGAAFLLVLVPIMSIMKAIEEEDMRALEALFRRIGAASSLFRMAVRYYRVFSPSTS